MNVLALWFTIAILELCAIIVVIKVIYRSGTKKIIKEKNNVHLCFNVWFFALKWVRERFGKDVGLELDFYLSEEMGARIWRPLVLAVDVKDKSSIDIIYEVLQCSYLPIIEKVEITKNPSKVEFKVFSCTFQKEWNRIFGERINCRPSMTCQLKGLLSELGKVIDVDNIRLTSDFGVDYSCKWSFQKESVVEQI